MTQASDKETKTPHQEASSEGGEATTNWARIMGILVIGAVSCAGMFYFIGKMLEPLADVQELGAEEDEPQDAGEL